MIKLIDGSLVEIETGTSSCRGCETCDYGSEYTNELTIIFENSSNLYIEASAMYAFPLKMDFLMKLFLQNLDHLKTLTEEECREFIISKVKEQCSKVEVS